MSVPGDRHVEFGHKKHLRSEFLKQNARSPMVIRVRVDSRSGALEYEKHKRVDGAQTLSND